MNYIWYVVLLNLPEHGDANECLPLFIHGGIIVCVLVLLFTVFDCSLLRLVKGKVVVFIVFDNSSTTSLGVIPVAFKCGQWLDNTLILRVNKPLESFANKRKYGQAEFMVIIK